MSGVAGTEPTTQEVSAQAAWFAGHGRESPALDTAALALGRIGSYAGDDNGLDPTERLRRIRAVIHGLRLFHALPGSPPAPPTGPPAPAARECYLSPTPNGWGCHDPQCGDSTWDHECPTGPCTRPEHNTAGPLIGELTAADLPHEDAAVRGLIRDALNAVFGTPAARANGLTCGMVIQRFRSHPEAKDRVHDVLPALLDRLVRRGDLEMATENRYRLRAPAAGGT